MTEAAPPLILVVDDDTAVLEGLGSLFRSLDMQVRLFTSAAGLMDSPELGAAGCLVLDVDLPGLDGLEVQRRFAAWEVAIPIVFMTGRGDIPMSVRAMKAGAVDFLTKPFDADAMLAAVRAALERDGERRSRGRSLDAVRERFATLSPRERQVVGHVAAGLLNKQIADAMGLSEITVKVHRGNAMRKLAVRNLPDLVRLHEAVATSPAPAAATGHRTAP
ncbi:response regulator [Roseomonas sp. OT10]|uniref:response regulator transcription factor n=1 Tax=Roseomonas cutis TaxID=2897332 RepID=UPI001E60F745|nr:response regulator [Roseomonas sp. OT10]UFN48478.1 response regulator [Roseomonas sp. OT10]